MPMGSGQIDVAFGNVLALRARGDGKQTGVRVVLGANTVNEAPPVSGSGRHRTHRQRWMRIEWITLAKSGSGGSNAALATHRCHRDRLLLLGSAFPDTRLQVAPTSNALAVTLDGPALAGSLLVPDADGAAIAGKLARLHWRAASVWQAAGAMQGRRAIRSILLHIPPLALDIDDLRFGDAQLDSAQLRTQPLPTACTCSNLPCARPGQKIDIQGDWTGRGAAGTHASDR